MVYSSLPGLFFPFGGEAYVQTFDQQSPPEQTNKYQQSRTHRFFFLRSVLKFECPSGSSQPTLFCIILAENFVTLILGLYSKRGPPKTPGKMQWSRYCGATAPMSRLSGTAGKLIIFSYLSMTCILPIWPVVSFRGSGQIHTKNINLSMFFPKKAKTTH